MVQLFQDHRQGPDPHKRLFGYCGYQSRPGRRNAEITGRTGEFLRSLLLFDHVTIHRLAFREFTTLVDDLGIDGTMGILKSGALSLFPDYVHFGTAYPFHLKHTRPLNRYSLSRINSIRPEIIPKYFQELRNYVKLSARDFERLIEAITGTLVSEPVDYGVAAENLARSDLKASEPLKLAVTASLRRKFGFAMQPEYFKLKMHNEGWDYVVETDLPMLCRLSDEQVCSTIEMAIAAVANFNLRFEEEDTRESHCIR